MPKPIVHTLLIAALSLEGCRETTVGPQDEGVAPPDPFVVTTMAGARFTGPAARIDIRRVSEAATPDVEVTFSASGNSGGTWAAQSMVPADFLETLTLVAPVVDGPLELGKAVVQGSQAGGETSSARSGVLRLSIRAGRLTGDTSGMDDRLAATFNGSFVVTCAVPAASIGVTAPTAGAGRGAGTTLIVDEKFESPLCKPYAALAGR